MKKILFIGIKWPTGVDMPLNKTQTQAIQFSQTVRIPKVALSISMVFVYKQLNVKSFRFQTIQLSKQKQFYLKQFILGAMAMKEYYAIPKAPALLEPPF